MVNKNRRNFMGKHDRSKEKRMELDNKNWDKEEIALIKPDASWSDYKSHYINALSSSWYKHLCEIQNIVSIATMQFYTEKNIGTMHLPITTGSISSPMGLGSDSLPVKVNLHGVDTYLADSMQFMLEYGCRIFDNGSYYLMPSFRGEHADERHLCQFYHSEAEIPGKLEDVQALAGEYLIYLCKYFLSNYAEKLLKLNGDNSHIEKVINLKVGLWTN